MRKPRASPRASSRAASFPRVVARSLAMAWWASIAAGSAATTAFHASRAACKSPRREDPGRPLDANRIVACVLEPRVAAPLPARGGQGRPGPERRRGRGRGPGDAGQGRFRVPHNLRRFGQFLREPSRRSTRGRSTRRPKARTRQSRKGSTSEPGHVSWRLRSTRSRSLPSCPRAERPDGVARARRGHVPRARRRSPGY